MIAISDVYEYLTALQNSICATLEAEDGNARFQVDDWKSALGSGSTRALADGDVIEKAGVNFIYNYYNGIGASFASNSLEMISSSRKV